MGHVALGDPIFGPIAGCVFDCLANDCMDDNRIRVGQCGVLLCCADAVTYRVARSGMPADGEIARLDHSLDIMTSPLISGATR